MKYTLLVTLLAFLGSCKTMNSDTMTQGIKGNVVWFEGNLMPSPGAPPVEGEPIERTIVICKLTNIDDLEGDGPLYNQIGADVIKEVKTDKKGNFSYNLPVGKYSVFVKEDSKFFANSFDSNNDICVVTVEENKVALMTIKVDYKASY